MATTVRFSGDRSHSLHRNLKAFWKLAETGGNRYDLITGGRLQDFNTVTQTRGRAATSQAGQFTSANSEYLQTPDNADLSVGDVDFSMCAWVYLDSKSADRNIVSKKDADAAGQEEYLLRYSSSNDRFFFKITTSGGTDVTVLANNLGSPATGTWYFVVAWHDATANTVNIQVNNGTADSTSTGANVPFDGPSAFRIGAENTSIAAPMNGRIAKVGFWKKTLSSQEKIDLYNFGKSNYYDGTVFYKDTAGTLRTNLKAWWELSESHGTRRDSVTPGSGPSAQFTRANSEYLSAADSATLSLGSDTAFSISVWVYLDSKPGYMTIIDKNNDTARESQNIEYAIDYANSADRFTFYVGNGSSAGTVQASTFGSPPTGQWIFITVWHDPTADTVNIQVNNGTVDSASWSGGTQNTAGALTIGRGGAFNGNYLNGRVSHAGFFKTILTTAHKTTLYNSGNGADVYNIGNLIAFASGWWDLNEPAGTRIDRGNEGIGTQHLTDNNTVTQAAGVSASNNVGDGNTVTTNAGVTSSDAIGAAAQFTGANNEYLAALDAINSDVTGNSQSFTIAAWVYMDAETANEAMGILSKGAGTAAGEYDIVYRTDIDRFTFTVYNFPTNNSNGILSFENMNTGAWYLVISSYDAVNTTGYLQINNGPLRSRTGLTVTPANSGTPFEIGRQGRNTPSSWNGRIALAGFWRKVLTATERRELYNGGFGTLPKCSESAPNSTKTLNDKLVSHWKLNEVSGTRLDYVAGNDLTDNNTVTQAAGKFGRGYAAQFTRANSEYLSRTNPAELSFGDTDFTVAAWVYLDAKPSGGTLPIFLKGVTTLEYDLQFDNNTSDRFSFRVASAGAASQQSVLANSFGSPSTGTWYLVVGWYDSVLSKIYIQINNGTVDSADVSFDVGFGGGDARMGNNGGGQYMDGRIDEASVWGRVLKPQERAELYNSGKGITPGNRFLADTSSILSQDLIAAWNFEETSGSRFDYVGGHTLTDNNTVGVAEGKIGNAAAFVVANTEYLSRADNSDLTTGDIDFTWAGWVYLTESNTLLQVLMSKWGSTNAEKSYMVFFSDAGTPHFVWRVIDSSGVITDLAETTTVQPSLNTWYFIVAWHDSVNNQIGIRINNQKADVQSYSAGVNAGTGPFQFSGFFSSGTGANSNLGGRLDSWGFWKRVLTPQEQSDLYNA